MIAKLHNSIQHYAWGSQNYIQDLIGAPCEDVMAEMWMGAHHQSPSMVEVDDGEIALDQVLKTHPEYLGDASERFDELPFLFKLLAAGQALSIQAHPDKESAEAGFARENAAGIDLFAAHRNYKDDNHKPEIICALTEFWGLNGFRPIDEILTKMSDAVGISLANEIEKFAKDPSREGLKVFYREILTLETDKSQVMLDELLKSAEQNSAQIDYEWVLRVNKQYPGDPSVISVLLLNLIKLNPGEAMFCGAGDLHSYLSGFGVELMANSNNVLRGGLTVKHIDRDELLKNLSFNSGNPRIIQADERNENESVYPADVTEFCLSKIILTETDYTASDSSFSIYICTEGQFKINGELHINQGMSFLNTAGETVQISGKGCLFRASIPLNK
ncbi:MAG: mannose-6-phosphate isomerase, class I [Lentisphaeria bacterium]|nr:mannose-6-phosphate isomerase, class I [Lentisphaeria bacterium]NQZ67745.1 mannose-6-phosphate isomerase, class I [Lentisphaeria bacterium]